MATPRPRLAVIPPDPPTGSWAAARPVQWAVAFLLGAALALLGGRIFRATETRPTERERVVIVTAVDLNQAGKTDLLQLPGVGESLATAILTARDQLGGFRSVDDLRQVHGIGPARFDTLRPFVRVDYPMVPISVATHTTNKPPVTSTKPDTNRPAGKKAPPAAPIDLNRASAEEFQQLPGVGPVLSQRMVAARAAAPFRSVDELRRVSGIGVKTLEKLRPLVTVSDPPPASDDAMAMP